MTIATSIDTPPAAEDRLDQAGSMAVRGVHGRADRAADVVACDLQRHRQDQPPDAAEFRHTVYRSQLPRPARHHRDHPITSAILCCVVAAPMGWLVSRTDMPARQFIRALVTASFVTPPFLGAVAWELLAAPNSGLLNQLYRVVTGARRAHEGGQGLRRPCRRRHRRGRDRGPAGN